MTLTLSIRHRIGDFALETDIEAPAGVTALYGPSGAGKTTLLNAIAGLVRPKAGRIVIAGTTLFDSVAGIDLPPHRRALGYLFQDVRLFPHLSAARNIAFGRRFARDRSPVASDGEITSLLGIQALLDRRPGGLSGGETQRIGLARALAAAPRCLLLDEPLAALDAARRAEILPYLERIRDRLGVPMIYVSHALPEVVRLASTVVVLDAGRVRQIGPPEVILSTPADDHAEGGALIAAKVTRHHPSDGLTEVLCSAGPLFLPHLDAAPGDPVRIRIAASDILIARDAPTGLSALNALPVVIETLRDLDATICNLGLRAGTDRLRARITRRSVRELGLAPGVSCHAVVKSVRVAGEDVGRRG